MSAEEQLPNSNDPEVGSEEYWIKVFQRIQEIKESDGPNEACRFLGGSIMEAFLAQNPREISGPISIYVRELLTTQSAVSAVGEGVLKTINSSGDPALQGTIKFDPKSREPMFIPQSQIPEHLQEK